LKSVFEAKSYGSENATVSYLLENCLCRGHYPASFETSHNFFDKKKQVH